MNQGTLFGLSVGPGDPELITVKALKILASCPVIAAPRTGHGRTLALDIAAQAVDLSDKTVLHLDFLMTRDKEKLQARHQVLARQLCAYLERGQDVALLNLGDASLYGSWSYINQAVQAMGYPTATIPGVTSFCAAAAALNTSLTEMERPLHIIPGAPEAAQGLALDGSKVLMKAGSALPRLRQMIRERGLDDKASLVANCGLEDEIICPRLDQAPDLTGYFTIILVRP